VGGPREWKPRISGTSSDTASECSDYTTKTKADMCARVPQ